MFNDVYVQLAAVDAAQKSKTRRRRRRRRRRASRRPRGSSPSRSARCWRALADAGATPGAQVAERAGPDQRAQADRRLLQPRRSPAAIRSPAAAEGRRAARRLRRSCSASAARSTTSTSAKLASLVDTGATPWTFKPLADGTRPVRRRRAWPTSSAPRAIREVFFRGGGKTPGVQGRPAAARDGRRPEGDGARHRRPVYQVHRRQHRGRRP